MFTCTSNNHLLDDKGTLHSLGRKMNLIVIKNIKLLHHVHVLVARVCRIMPKMWYVVQFYIHNFQDKPTDSLQLNSCCFYHSDVWSDPSVTVSMKMLLMYKIGEFM